MASTTASAHTASMCVMQLFVLLPQPPYHSQSFWDECIPLEAPRPCGPTDAYQWFRTCPAFSYLHLLCIALQTRHPMIKKACMACMVCIEQDLQELQALVARPG
ncbi:hypothetical protein ABBQ32_009861 [Trebouxia sp. C0010 RCD-2024]